MIQEISSSTSTMPIKSELHTDLSESRERLKALLNSAHSYSPDSENNKVVNSDHTSDIKHNKDKSEQQINYTSLSSKIQQLMDNDDLEVRFDKDKETNIMVMKFIDKSTQDTIKQYPPEITIQVAKIVADYTKHGVITDATV